MIVDLIIILVILLFTFLGYKKGLVKTAIGVLSFFIALVVSILLYKTIGNIVINNTQIDENIEQTITSKVTLEELQEILPESVVKTGEETVNELAQTISHKTIYIATFVVLFVALRIALIFAKFLAGIVTKIPFIKQIDKVRRNCGWLWKRLFTSNSNTSSSATCFTNDRPKIY